MQALKIRDILSKGSPKHTRPEILNYPLRKSGVLPISTCGAVLPAARAFLAADSSGRRSSSDTPDAEDDRGGFSTRPSASPFSVAPRTVNDVSSAVLTACSASDIAVCGGNDVVRCDISYNIARDQE